MQIIGLHGQVMLCSNSIILVASVANYVQLLQCPRAFELHVVNDNFIHDPAPRIVANLGKMKYETKFTH